MSGDISAKFAEVEEPTLLPAAPSRPAVELSADSGGTKIMGMHADTWALMIHRKIDEVSAAQLEALHALAANFTAVKNDVRDGFARVFEVLEAQERHEQQLHEHRRELNELSLRVFALDDRTLEQDKQLTSQASRIAELELGLHAANDRIADLDLEISTLRKARARKAELAAATTTTTTRNRRIKPRK